MPVLLLVVFLLLQTPPLLFMPVVLVQAVTLTESGYDNLEGEDATCWSAPSFARSVQNDNTTNTIDGTHWANPLVPDFEAGPTTMLPKCPSGTSLQLTKYHEQIHGSHKLRTHHFYSFRFKLEIDLDEIRNDYQLAEHAFFYSHKYDDSNHTKSGTTHPLIQLQLQFCPINGNLCSPFMLEKLFSIDADLDLDVNVTSFVKRLQVGSLQKEDQKNVTSQGTNNHHDFELHGSIVAHSKRFQDDDSSNHNNTAHQQQQHSSDPSLFDRQRRRDLIQNQQQRQQQLQEKHTTAPGLSIAKIWTRIRHAIHNMTTAPLATQTQTPQVVVSNLQVSYNATFGFPSRIVVEYTRIHNDNDSNDDALDSNRTYMFAATIANLQPIWPVQENSNNSSSRTSREYFEIITTPTEEDNDEEESDNPSTTNHTAIVWEEWQTAHDLWESWEMDNYSFEYFVLIASDDMEDDHGGWLFPSLLQNDQKNNGHDDFYPWTVSVQNGRVRLVEDAQNNILFEEDLSATTSLEDHNNSTTIHDASSSNNSNTLASNEYIDEYGHHHTLTDQILQNMRDHLQGAAMSPEFYMELTRSKNESFFQIHYNVTIQVEDAGDYIPMATVLFFLTNDTTAGDDNDDTAGGGALYKFDIANLLHNRSITFYDPIQINEVHKGAL